MSRGCYICRPDDPKAPDEGCSDCERRYVTEYVIPASVVTGEITTEEAGRIITVYNVISEEDDAE